MSGMRVAILPGVAAMALLVGCSGAGGPRSGANGGAWNSGSSIATSSYEERGSYKVGRPYRVFGVWYTPKENFAHSEVGVASWYGADFNGMPTANGEKYDMYALTAAHPTLQLPSIARVTNLENGRAVVVRINDRGPFANSRAIDLSYAAAEALGFARQGTTQVRIDVMPEESRKVAELARDGADVETQMAALGDAVRGQQRGAVSTVASDDAVIRAASYAPAVQDSNLYIQAGAFVQRDNAVRLSAALSRFGKTRIDTVAAGGRNLHRVRLGPLSDVAAADSTLSSLQRNGYSLAQIVVE
ncbi:rare lipoprotein A [Constrictibacter sp. MBR-5]|jgi:rare lipoprotein A|uniref:septal ring lytic transglycosylase RlpA family protein n=1 Tax=Constrictibacter sp. MBR-5 TaxID=3156467 RepID=UPI003390C9C6